MASAVNRTARTGGLTSTEYNTGFDVIFGIFQMLLNLFGRENKENNSKSKIRIEPSTTVAKTELSCTISTIETAVR